MVASSILRWISFSRKASKFIRGWDAFQTEPWQPRPWLMLPPTVERRSWPNTTAFTYNFYNLTDCRLITFQGDSDQSSSSAVVGSSRGWLASYNKRNWDVFLSNPITGCRVDLPSALTLPITDDQTRKRRGKRLTKGELRELHGKPYKIIVNSCNPDIDPDSRAIMCFGLEQRLATCCPSSSSSSSEWTPIGSLHHENEIGINDKYGARVARVYQDFAYSTVRKRLYCVTQFINLECWDLGDPTSPRLDWKVEEGERSYPFAAATEQEFRLKSLCRSIKYLVVAEKSNRVFLVRRSVVEHVCPDGSYVFYDNTDHKDDDADYSNYRNTYKTVGFDVHEINGENGELVRYMDGTLDGMTLFVGSSGDSIAIESPGSLNLMPNTIYFTDPKELTPALSWNVSYGGHDIGFFDYQNKTFLGPHIKRLMPQPMWFTPSPYPSQEEDEPLLNPFELMEDEEWEWDREWKGKRKGKRKNEDKKEEKKKEKEKEKGTEEEKKEEEQEKGKEEKKEEEEHEKGNEEKKDEEKEEEEDFFKIFF